MNENTSTAPAVERRRKRVAWAVVLGAIILVTLVIRFAFFQGTYTLTITNEQIEEHLSRAFPVQKNYIFIDVRWSDPVVSMEKADARVLLGVSVRVSGNLDGKNHGVESTMRLCAALRYEPDEYAFYLDDSKFERLSIEGIPDKWTLPAEKAATQGIEAVLAKHPAYVINSLSVRDAVARLLLDDVVVTEQGLVVTWSL